MRFLLSLCCFFTFCSVLAQDLEIDSAQRANNKYLESGYYDSIAVASPDRGGEIMPYEQLVQRYETEEFDYRESLAEQLSFFERFIQRFWKFASSILPNNSWVTQENMENIIAIVGIIFFAYLLYKFFISDDKVYRRLKKETQDAEEVLSFVEKNLMTVDVRQYIKQALDAQDYKLAIRYQQLLNIQVLARKQLIDWDYTKTNVELMESVDNTEMKVAFMDCASIFDRVWFGDVIIDASNYSKLVVQFEQFQKRWS